MPKIKTHKTAAKRFSVTKTGKLARRRSYGAHKLTNKSPDRKRRSAQPAQVSAVDVARVKRMLGKI
ncbi:MAG: 50S ribosomal protein L35 [Patescibacteria group bacterium]|jgi:large subunit ribosomal protein L35